ncbi:hypothetical protein WKW79_34710 [Variovorax robiniae]|uniref:Uncharacterized protein n=1 Tax=Variovorax robiniae TaxID=1836199 RepID=A0ABU8XIP1_9BURK
MGSELRARCDGRDGAFGAAAPGTAAADPRLRFLLDLLNPNARSVGRVRQFLEAIEACAAVEARVREWWTVFVREVELTAMLADHGFSPRSAFLSEFGASLRRSLLPAAPETIDASSVLRSALPVDSNAAWLQQLDADLLRRIVAPAHDRSGARGAAFPRIDGRSWSVARRSAAPAARSGSPEGRVQGLPRAAGGLP